MIQLPLMAFTDDDQFPFVIQYGFHENSMYMHSHKDFSELVIILDGTAEHIVDNEHYRIRKGDVFVISHDTAHGYEDAKNFRMCNVMFQPDFFFTTELDITQSAGFQALFILEPHCTRISRFCSRLKLGVSDYTQVLHIIQSLYREYTEKQTGWKSMVTSDFLKLVITLSRLYDFEKIDDKANIIKLASAVAYMEQHYAESISVSQLVSLSHYSERQFIRLFKETFLCIPMVYLTNLRMQKARELLKTSNLPISEIAVRCGYCDSNYFSRVFKKYNDMTPSAYKSAF